MPTQQDKFKQAQAQLSALQNQANALKQKQTQSVVPQAPVGSIDVTKLSTNVPKFDIPVYTPPVATPRLNTITSTPETEQLGKTKSGLQTKIADIEKRLLGVADIQADKYKEFDIAQRKEDLNAQRSRILNLQAEAQGAEAKVLKQYEGTVGTTAAAQAEVNKLVNSYNQRITTESALFSAMQGDVNTAIELFNESVDMAVEPLKFEYDMYNKQYESVKNDLTAAEQKVAEENKRIYQEDIRLAEIDRDNKKQIAQMGFAVLEATGNVEVARQIVSGNLTPEEAMFVAAPSLIDPNVKLEKQLDLNIKKQQLNKLRVETQNAINEGRQVNLSANFRGQDINFEDPKQVANLPVSNLAKAVMTGMTDVKGLTPTDKAAVISELYDIGFNPNDIVNQKLAKLATMWAAIPDGNKGFVQGLQFWDSSYVPEVAAFESAKTVLTREVARLRDVGMLSDQDVASYTQAMPSRQDQSSDVVNSKLKGIQLATVGKSQEQPAKPTQTFQVGQLVRIPAGYPNAGKLAEIGADGETLVDPQTKKPL